MSFLTAVNVRRAAPSMHAPKGHPRFRVLADRAGAVDARAQSPVIRRFERVGIDRRHAYAQKGGGWPVVPGC